MSNAQQIDAPIIKLTKGHLDKLKQMAAAPEIGRYRYCLHKDHIASIQEMIICLYGDNYFAPHRHPDGVVESYHMIEGEMDVYTFDNDGKILGCTRLSALNLATEVSTFFHKVTTSIYHTVVPRSQFVLYHEVLTGPWQPNYTSQTAPFAPEASDSKAIQKFIENLNEFKQ